MHNTTGVLIEGLITQALVPLNAAVQLSRVSPGSLGDREAQQLDQANTGLEYLLTVIRRENKRWVPPEDHED